MTKQAQITMDMLGTGEVKVVRPPVVKKVKPAPTANPVKAPAARGAKTAQLVALFDQVGVEALCLSMAQDMAEDAGMNRTSASITFYRWRAARVAGLDVVPASSASAAKAFAAADAPKH